MGKDRERRVSRPKGAVSIQACFLFGYEPSAPERSVNTKRKCGASSAYHRRGSDKTRMQID